MRDRTQNISRSRQVKPPTAHLNFVLCVWLEAGHIEADGERVLCAEPEGLAVVLLHPVLHIVGQGGSQDSTPTECLLRNFLCPAYMDVVKVRAVDPDPHGSGPRGGNLRKKLKNAWK